MTKISIEKKFIYISLIFGILFCLLIPPFQSPDEDNHFKKAYVISKGELYPKNEKGAYGHTIENGLLDYINQNSKFNSDLEKKFSFKEMYFNQFIPREYSGEKITNFSTVGLSFLAYIVPAFGILVSKVCFKLMFSNSANYLYMLYFARLFNLVMYIILVTFAIKKTPILKKTFFTIGLVPMSLFLASSVSYDGLMIASTMLLFAYIFHFINNKKNGELKLKDFISIILISIILFNVKYVYCPLCFLLLTIPKSKFYNSEKTKILLKAFVIVVLATILLKLPYSIIGGGTEYPTYTKQFNWILSHPFKFSLILISNMFKQASHQLNIMIGGMGQIDTHIPGIIVVLLSINLIFIGLCENIKDSSKIKLNIKQRIFVFLILVIICAGIYTGLYIIWTSLLKIGGNEIVGVQGRYFIPILIYTFILVPFNKLINKEKLNNVKNVILDNYALITFIGLLTSSMTLLLRYWC